MSKASSEELLLWQERVKACQSSKLSIKNWCKENSIIPSTYQYWAKKFIPKSVSSETKWGEVKVASIKVSSNLDKPIILRYHEFTLEVPTDFNKSALAEIISAIKSIFRRKTY